MAYSADVIDVHVRYDTRCSDVVLPVQGSSFTPSVCHVALIVEKTIPGPVFVYYELDNFYQNHRRYVKSLDVS